MAEKYTRSGRRQGAHRRADRHRRARPSRDGASVATSRAAQRRRLSRRRQTRIALALLVLVVLLLSMCGWQFAEYKSFQQKRAAVEIETFYDGTFIEGIDVSLVTLNQAIAHWSQNVEPAYSERSVTLSDGTVVTSEMVGYTSNYQSVLLAAYNAGREGGMDERFETVSSVESGVDYVVTRAAYTLEGIAAFVAELAKGIDCAPTDEVLTGFNEETYELEFSEGAPGQQVDQEKLCADIAAAFDAGGGTVEIPLIYTPYVSNRSGYGIIASYDTDASDSSSARIHNIRQASATINGVCIQPGQTFSFNTVVGERTKSTGYRPAPAYTGSGTSLEYGGGICQVSSTLYAAVLQTDLQVTERHPHSIRVTYIPRGKDATVDWNHKDFKFVNNTEDPIYIACRVDDDMTVHVAIFGRL